MDKFEDEVNELLKIRKNPVLVFIKQEINYLDCLKCLKQINDRKFAQLDMIINSGGGDLNAAYKITKLLLKRSKKITIIVPLFAKSAATLICLGADELILGELGELGPLDTQIPEAQEGDSTEHKSALNYFKALDQLQQYAIKTMDAATLLLVERSGLKIAESVDLAIKLTGEIVDPLFSQVNPQKLGESARALDIAKQYGLRILIDHKNFSRENATNLLELLIKGYSSHGFVLDTEELDKLGLNAKNSDGDEYKCIEKIRDAILEVKGPIIKFFEPSGVESSKNIKKEAKNGKK